MDWDLGVRAIGLLLLMSGIFGIVAQALFWRTSIRWLWAVGFGAYFASGLFISEVWFGWATEEDLQPNVDGLSFDEVLLLAPLMSIVVVVAAWLVTRRVRAAHPA